MIARVSLAVVLCTAACKGGHHDRVFAPDVFGATVAPPGALGKLHPGMTVAEAKKVAPGLVPAEGEGTFPSGVAGMTFTVTLSADGAQIDAIRANLPYTAVDVLERAWGPGKEALRYGEPSTWWFDEATRTRAVLWPLSGEAEYRLEFARYVPVSELLRARPGAFAFETKPVLGAKLADLRAAYPALVEEAGDQASIHLYLPTSTWGADAWTNFYFDVVDPVRRADGDTVRAIKVKLPCADPGAPAELVTAWGPGEDDADPDAHQIDYSRWFDPAARRRAVAINFRDGQCEVDVTPYLPLVALLGDAPDRLGFETTPILGATRAEVAAAYPDYTRGGEHTMLLWLPPTEYDEMFTYVDGSFDKDGKVVSYRFGVDRGPSAGSSAAIRAALETKFGKAKQLRDDAGNLQLVLRAARPRITATETPAGWVIEVSATP